MKPHLVKMWCIPPEANAEFVWRMEAVLDVYKMPYDPDYPQVCMDESSKQLVAEVRSPIEVKPGKVRRFDNEYERKGTCNLFMFFEPLRGLAARLGHAATSQGGVGLVHQVPVGEALPQGQESASGV